MKRKVLQACMIIATGVLLANCMKTLSESYTDSAVGFNGGFEEVKNNLAVNWLFYTENTTGIGDFDILIDSSTFVEGNHSLRISVNHCSSKGGRLSPGIAQEVDAIEGDVYRVSFYIKNEGTTFLVKLGSVSAFQKKVGQTIKSSERISEWEKHEFVYQVPENMERLRFEVNVLSKGDFWIDKIEINKETEA